MTSQEALNILVQAVQAANLKGAYTLQDSALIAEAVKLFTTSTKQPTEAPSEPQKVAGDILKSNKVKK